MIAKAGTTAGGTAGRSAAAARGIRRGSSGFESEFASYLHARLRLHAFCLMLLLAAVYVLDVVSLVLMGEGWASFTGLLTVALGIDTVLVTGWWLFSRRERLSRRALVVFDAALYCHSAGLAIFLYHTQYGNSDQMLSWLSAAIVGRAVVVPSRVRPTLLLGLATVAIVLGIDILHGLDGHDLALLGGRGRAEAFSSAWWYAIAWREIALCAFVTVATTASKVNFALRLKAYEAKELDQYVLEGRIGQGAMGEVHRARHALMKRPVAIKFLRAELVGDAVVKRFEKEVQSTCRLTHPNTIAIYDYGQTQDGFFYYAMEHLEGADLERLVERTGPLSAARAIHVLVQACGALEEAHTQGLVHRDVKSGNLFLCEAGLGGRRDVVKVMDFGLVRDTAADAAMTHAGEVLGTPHTIAPECVRGRPATAASDIYALGAVGCFLLTGQQIFDATTVGEFVSAHLTSEPVSPRERVATVPEDLEAVLLRCLRKPAADRFASADDLRTALLACTDANRWTDADAKAWWDANRATLVAEASQATA